MKKETPRLHASPFDLSSLSIRPCLEHPLRFCSASCLLVVVPPLPCLRCCARCQGMMSGRTPHGQVLSCGKGSRVMWHGLDLCLRSIRTVSLQQAAHQCAASWLTVDCAGKQKGMKSISSKRAALGGSRRASGRPGRSSIRRNEGDTGMVLPFEPLNVTFHHVDYFVDLPSVCCSTLEACIVKPLPLSVTFHHLDHFVDLPLVC